MFVCVHLPLCLHPRMDTEVYRHTHTNTHTHTHTHIYPGLGAQGVCILHTHAHAHAHIRIAQNTKRRAKCTCAQGLPRWHLLNTSQTPPAPFHCASLHFSLYHTPVSVCTCQCVSLSVTVSLYLSVFASSSARVFLPRWATFPGNFSCSYRPDFQVFVDC